MRKRLVSAVQPLPHTLVVVYQQFGIHAAGAVETSIVRHAGGEVIGARGVSEGLCIMGSGQDSRLEVRVFWAFLGTRFR